MRNFFNNSDCRRLYSAPKIKVEVFSLERNYCSSVAIDNTMYFVDMKETDLSDYWED